MSYRVAIIKPNAPLRPSTVSRLQGKLLAQLTSTLKSNDLLANRALKALRVRSIFTPPPNALLSQSLPLGNLLEPFSLTVSLAMLSGFAKNPQQV